MIHPDTELRWVSGDIGLGVFATQRIPKGTITWVLDPLDRLLDDTEISPPYRSVLKKYTYRTASGELLLTWDLCRYMNHSCEANTISPGLDFELAIRDIEAGEQLTSDYTSLNLDEGFSCLCGAEGCRRWVCDAQFESLVPHWDHLIRGAFAHVGEVAQPLWDLLACPRAVLEGVRDPAQIPSVRSTRFEPAATAGVPQRLVLR